MPDPIVITTSYKSIDKSKPLTMDELINAKAAELQDIYNNRTAGNKTFEGFLSDFTRLAIASIASELVSGIIFKE